MAIKSGETTFYQAKRGIVQDGLILNIDTMLDQNSGTSLKDLSSSSRTVNINNMSGFTKTSEGLILDFDGTDDNVSIIDSSDELRFESSSFSVGVWLYLTNQGQGVTTRVIGKRCNGNPNVIPYWSIRVYGAGSGGVNPLVQCQGGSQVDGVDIGPFSYNTWTYLAATFLNGDGGTNKTYHNGTLLKSGTTTYSTPFGYSANYQVLLGTVSSWNSGEEYKIGPVHIYNKELSAEEVLQNYNATRHRFGV
jgi:hypothetical protein